MKKPLLILSLIFVLLSAYGQTNYYVATTGSDSDPGTIAQPFLTIQYGLDQLTAGDTLFIRVGTYSITNYLSIDGSVDGTALNPIVVMAYPGESVIIDGDAAYQKSGSWIRNASYWTFRNLTIRNFWQDGSINDVKGWYLQNCDQVYMINCVAYNIGGPGFATGDDVGGGGSYFFTNCDSYDNYDPDSDNPGNDADGWTLIGQMSNTDTTSWPKIYIDSCRAWNNSDDGYDQVYGAYLRITNSWAVNNGWSGDGNGMKGGLSAPAMTPEGQLLFRNNVSVYNINGLRINSNSATYFPDVTFYNNTSAYNSGTNFNGSFMSPQTGGQATFKNNIAYGKATDLGWLVGANFEMEPGMSYTSEYNSWDVATGITLSAIDFVSVDSTGITAARQADGSLPDNNCYNYFLRLASGSDIIDAGTDVSLAFGGTAPDLGAFESDLDETATDIITFTLADQTGAATINATTHTVAIEVAYTADITNLTPTITLSYGATVSPTSGTAGNFTTPQTYTVTALDGTTTQAWVVTVTQEAAPASPTGSSLIMKFGSSILKL